MKADAQQFFEAKSSLFRFALISVVRFLLEAERSGSLSHGATLGQLKLVLRDYPETPGMS